MGATICWQRVDPSPETIDAMAPSSFMEQMERAGLELPCEVGEAEKGVLTGLSAAWGKDHNPYEHILKLIDRHGTIKLWADY